MRSPEAVGLFVLSPCVTFLDAPSPRPVSSVAAPSNLLSPHEVVSPPEG